jgi:diguanylate cyclase (GGDEF)-like protein/PAS domain S-box-containing protein
MSYYYSAITKRGPNQPMVRSIQTANIHAKEKPSARTIKTLRHHLLHISIVHRDTAVVRAAVDELKLAHFCFRADVYRDTEQFTKRLASKRYDVILTEYVDPDLQNNQVLELLQLNGSRTPVIVLMGAGRQEAVAELTRMGVADCIETGNMGHLPVVVRRQLREEKLREQRDRAEEKLRHSEAHYRALVGNLTYGICHCTPKGKLLDVNQTLVTMLGYATRRELLASKFARAIICDPFKRDQLFGVSGKIVQSDSLEIDWERKDGTALKAKVSSREVVQTDGTIGGYEIIAEDLTKQRELENRLRREAAKDPLTGLANYRSLVDALDGEIKRSTRTGREFALLLFDLDDLKKINDSYGHVEGSKTLCRLADAMLMGCRDIDTAARFGGDEFALVLPETSALSATVVAERISTTFASHCGDFNFTVSVGVASHPEDGESIESLLAAADLALYAMKARVHSNRA